MKIAFFLSSKNKVTLDTGGGVEYSAYYLICALLELGHEITLYAASGSKIAGVKIIEISPSLANIKQEYANLTERIISFYDLCALGDFFIGNEWKKFDLIQYNNYIFYEILPFIKNVNIPIVIRVNYPHSAIYPYMKDKLKDFKNVHYLPDSDFIKTTMPGLPYLDTVYPAINFDDFPLAKEAGEYLLFIGRICSDKGTHISIEVAQRSGKKLVIAGAVAESQIDYFNKKIRPYIDNDKITYVGDVNFKIKVKIYQKAIATLFPIQWDEPFGMVMLESMACGTPVIAFDRAATGEVIKNNVNGFIVPDQDIGVMADAVKQAARLNRRIVRESTEENFSINKQAAKYASIVKKFIKK